MEKTAGMQSPCVRVPTKWVARNRWNEFEVDLMHEIAIAVATGSDTLLLRMKSDSRAQPEANARMIAIAVAVLFHPKWRPAKIADYFRRDASMVRCASMRVSNALKHHPHSSLCKDTLRVCDKLGILPSQLFLK